MGSAPPRFDLSGFRAESPGMAVKGPLRLWGLDWGWRVKGARSLSKGRARGGNVPVGRHDRKQKQT